MVCEAHFFWYTQVVQLVDLVRMREFPSVLFRTGSICAWGIFPITLSGRFNGE